ncbi:TPA: ferritin, partial [Candidatus Woesearchaeota archaeon]|nr:ferritin [Candidatus Woesearchaeota archaeon]
MKKEMLEALNRQIYEETNSAYIYAGMAAWLGAQGLRGMERWMVKQVKEELEHAEKLFKYVSAHGAVVLEALPKPQTEWASALAAFQAADEHEKYITGCIKRLSEQAESLGDTETKEFLQWYI